MFAINEVNIFIEFIALKGYLNNNPSDIADCHVQLRRSKSNKDANGRFSCEVGCGCVGCGCVWVWVWVWVWVGGLGWVGVGRGVSVGNVPGIPGACATRNFVHVARTP